jgi:hypothetical protein
MASGQSYILRTPGVGFGYEHREYHDAKMVLQCGQRHDIPSSSSCSDDRFLPLL